MTEKVLIEKMVLLRREIAKAKEDQKALASTLGGAMKFFVRTLLREQVEQLHYFIHYVTQNMNKQSKLVLSPIRADYSAAFKELKKLET